MTFVLKKNYVLEFLTESRWLVQIGRMHRTVHFSSLPMKVGRVSPLSLFEWFGYMPSNLGGNAGVTLVPIFGDWGSFLFSKLPHILDLTIVSKKKGVTIC